MQSRTGVRKRGKLTASGDFDRVYRKGRSQAGEHLVVYEFDRGPTEEGTAPVRLGISVSRKVGAAAKRNKVKRLLREAFWAHGEDLPAGTDYVLVARPSILAVADEHGLEGVSADLDGLLTSSGRAEGISG